MITSNAKIYDELIKNPTILEFDYSFSQLSNDLDFKQISGKSFKQVPIIKFQIHDLIQKIYQLYLLINIKFQNFWWLSRFKETIKDKLQNVENIGLILNNNNDLELFNNIDKLVELMIFCLNNDIQNLSIISTIVDDRNYMNYDIIDAVKICLKHNKILKNLDSKMKINLINDNNNNDVQKEILIFNGFELDSNVELNLNFKHVSNTQVLEQADVNFLITFD